MRSVEDMSRALPIAAVQAPPIPVGTAFSVFADQVRDTLRRFPQTKLLIFPELHLFGLSGADDRAELEAAAEPLDGPRMQALGRLSAELGIHLLPGSVCERGPAGELFNTAPVFSPAGELIAHYRKVFPWRPYEPFTAGDRFVVFDLAGVGRAGLSICYDAWFPEVTRHLAWMGAEVIFNLVQTTTADRVQEQVLARANAIVNQVFMVSVNTAGPIGTGLSLIVDPEGLVRTATSGANSTVLTDVLDLDHAARVREFGTAGLTRPWSQFQAGDAPIDLPLYGGAIDPARWAAGTVGSSGAGAGDGTSSASTRAR